MSATKQTLEDLLEDVFVMDPDQWENDEGPAGWYAVGDGFNGIIAYFYSEQDAYRYRLAEINRRLNG